jgi:rare lipoprotein A
MIRTAVLIGLVFACAGGAADAQTAHHHRPRATNTEKKPARDPARQVGKASTYAHHFAGRKMADGTRMDPESDNAASKTLPLGSTARVTNLRTGRSATVTIRDRGPHVPGRIIDLSPATAREIGLTRRQGVAPVEVTRIEKAGDKAPGGFAEAATDKGQTEAQAERSP